MTWPDQSKAEAQEREHLKVAMPSTATSLVGLFTGLALGILIEVGFLEFLAPLAVLIEPLGTVWSRALQMVVFPLAVASLIGAVASGSLSLGRVVIASLGLFLLLLILGTFFAIATTVPLLPLIPVTSESIPSFDVAPENETIPLDTPGATSLREWLVSLIPANVLMAAAEGNLAQVLVFAMLFALAMSRLPYSQRTHLSGLIASLLQALLLIVQWILRVTPIAVSFSRQRGLEAGGLLGRYDLLISAVLVAMTLLLYPIAVFAGHLKLGVFSRALFAGQMVAVSTRSSLASAPTLLQSALTMMPLHKQTIAFSIPFAASVFKLNRTVSGMVKFLFLGVCAAGVSDQRGISNS